MLSSELVQLLVGSAECCRTELLYFNISLLTVAITTQLAGELL